MAWGAAPGERRGGRGKGAVNQKTIVKRMMDEVMREHGREYLGKLLEEAHQAPRGKKALDMLRELATLSMNCVAIYQPTKTAAGVNLADPERLKDFMAIAVRAVGELAQYEAPKLKAMHVQIDHSPVIEPKVIDLTASRGQVEATATYLRIIRQDGEAA